MYLGTQPLRDLARDKDYPPRVAKRFKEIAKGTRAALIALKDPQSECGKIGSSEARSSLERGIESLLDQFNLRQQFVDGWIAFGESNDATMLRAADAKIKADDAHLLAMATAVQLFLAAQTAVGLPEDLSAFKEI